MDCLTTPHLEPAGFGEVETFFKGRNCSLLLFSSSIALRFKSNKVGDKNQTGDVTNKESDELYLPFEKLPMLHSSTGSLCFS
jgi:hypothetical protein